VGYADPAKAKRLSEAAAQIAIMLHDDAALALSERCMGNVAYVSGRQEEAVEHYRRALRLFERVERDAEIGRTLSSGLQALSYMGRYEEAFAWADRARAIFRTQGDELRLARLASNVGNILFRQDRHAEALESYEEALAVLQRTGEPRDVAAILSNMASCHTGLGQFSPALDYYGRARDYCVTHELSMLAAAADYNIAWLHYLRGDYLRAIHLYEATRAYCGRVDDRYHAALCDLDQSEIYLELNLTDEAGELARSAAMSFETLRMGYERAKAVVNQAVAENQKRHAVAALRLFSAASRLFIREGNETWPAVIRLYQAAVYYRQKRFAAAERLARRAWKSLAHSPVPGKAALCRLLQAELLLEKNDAGGARALCIEVLDQVAGGTTPSLRFHAEFLLGRSEETAGRYEDAARAYRSARGRIEDLRNRLWTEDLKISILKDKVGVYEGLVHLLLERRVSSAAPETEAFQLIQEAKSRSLADEIVFPSQPEPPGEVVSELRRELNWHYREMENAAFHMRAGENGRMEATHRRVAEYERSLTRAQALSPAHACLPAPDTLPLDTIRASIPNHATLLEYYEVRGVLHVCLLSSDGLRIVRLSPTSQIRGALSLLQFQMEKFRLGPEYVRTFATLLREATLVHLRALYRELIAPIRSLLKTRHLIVAPHGSLHQVPFHALQDGDRFLLDDFTVSIAPSASVFALCAARQPNPQGGALVLGVPNASAPWIGDEARDVAALLPGSRLLVGGEASEANLRCHAPKCRYLHIASHGIFRRHNPAFSSIALGDSDLTLHELYGLHLSAELVVLSGCNTGMNAVTGADELIGLMRGLLHAGAHGLLLSLWDVHDRSTADFMSVFYRKMGDGVSPAESLRHAALEIRDRYPHPWHWAPFCLIGRYE